MDAIDDVFGSMRTHTALYARIEGSAPWGVAFVRGRAARFGLVVRGRVWLTVEGDAPIAMSAGDCYVIARGAQYALQDDPDSPTKFCFDALREHKHRVVHLGGGRDGGGARDGGGGGAAATVVTGWFMFDTVGAKPLFDLMPKLILTRVDDERAQLIQTTLQLFAIETGRRELGTSIVVSRLADILFIQAIRAYAQSAGEEAGGWLGALGDARLAPAFRAIHARVEHGWTVEELAGLTSMSRSTFAARFRSRVGLTPLDYVARWRMFRAGAMLRRNQSSVAEIAYKVGYENESAFAKAFKRITGVTPGTYRRSGGEAAFAPPVAAPDPRADGLMAA